MESLQQYRERILKYKSEMQLSQQKLKRLSLIRIACFLASGYFGYKYIFSEFEAIWWIPIAIALILFGLSLVRYQKVKEQSLVQEQLLWLNESELKALQGEDVRFEDGIEFVNDQHDFTGDLDVFGQHSLFNHINRTGTYSGKMALAANFIQPGLNVEDIVRQQEAVKELRAALDWRQNFTAQGRLSNEQAGDMPSIQQWLQMPLEFLHKKGWRIFSFVNPALLIAAIIYGSMPIILFFFALNWIALLLNIANVNKQHQLISNKEKLLKRYGLLLGLIKNLPEQTSSEVLLQLKQSAGDAGNAVNKLSRINSYMDQRLNMLVGIFLNSVFLYDLHCIYALEKWKQQYGSELEAWMNVIKDMEVLNSLSTFSYNNPAYQFPLFTADEFVIKGTAIGHPLIAAEKCIKNDFEIGQHNLFHIITGSNMSGKSTFLRSVGVNYLLAMMGAPVCAARFECKPSRIMTSMRIKDSIANNTSYFQAELLRLQKIIRVLQAGESIFIILDEILKGTNSEDKLTGSRELVQHFLAYKCIGMIATHDLELGHLEEKLPGKVSNYCFESSILDGERLVFDYKMRAGIATNKNATFLMKQMEII
ncbi:hypothetical protein COR50_03260 [Chitinophaga caeni]|uniref:DNA mismatch repair proteins mutS family domain-containing protein n=1 Tax=Chitinophaga caeni TaxID=2029983 RepID=A0A291QQQ2_9BACT|nr:hypothetical protein [Chitinophaga caeni]ATL46266.1 hypothetical protein COR50_03260 [Chitinophaga caeni]